MVDDKHQVIMHAEGFGEAQEQELLVPMMEGTADSGFHSENNVRMLMEQGVDAYVADHQFRKRDPRFKDVDRYKERHRRERAALSGKTVRFSRKDFTLSADQRSCICPAGKRLYRNGGNVVIHGYRAIKFRGRKTDCRVCEFRSQCLKHPDRTEAHQAHLFLGARNQHRRRSARR